MIFHPRKHLNLVKKHLFALEDAISAETLVQESGTWVDMDEHGWLYGESSKKLVGGLEHFSFFHILGIIIPTDELIFFRGLETTNQKMLAKLLGE
jgi:hypothetical protein